MSIDTNREKCVVCNAYLFLEDDVVYCPHCGAPHHRDCYNSIGHCALEEFHDTEQQYKKPEPEVQQPDQETQHDNFITCGMCGEKYDRQEISCPKCNTLNVTKAGAKFVTFDFLGGVPADTDLGNGVTADEVKKFVASNTHRYIPKFLKFSKGKKLSWNWLAFLVPCAWLSSRKMYLLAALVGAIQIAISMLSLPLFVAVQPLYESAGYDSVALASMLAKHLPDIGIVAIAVAFIGSILDILTRVIIAVFGDIIYRNHVIAKISEIKRESEEVEFALLRSGGISFIAAAIGYFAVNYLPTILANALGLM